MKVQEILLELNTKGYYKPHFDDDTGHMRGAIGKWYNTVGIKPEHVEQAMAKVRSNKELMDKLHAAGFIHKPTKGMDKNGTFNFHASWAPDVSYQVYGNGQIRRNGKKDNVENRPITRLKSLKPRMVSGDNVATLVKTYTAALQHLADKKVNK